MATIGTTTATIGTTTINFNRILMETVETKITPTTHMVKDSRPTSQIRIGDLPSTRTLEWVSSYVTNLVMLPKCADHTPHLSPDHKSTTQLMRIRVINQAG